jgi:hypothetical protein
LDEILKEKKLEILSAEKRKEYAAKRRNENSRLL